MPLGEVNAADGFAMTMVAILILSLGTVTLLVTTIFRSGKAKGSEVDDLLDELRRDEEAGNQPHPHATSGATDPWEKPADWWKPREP